MSSRIALVTGGNQGIGLEIVRQLCKKFEGTVILAARSVQRGEEAVKALQSEDLHPHFLKLDVDEEESIQSAKDTVKEKYGRLDVLINNAAIYYLELTAEVPLEIVNMSSEFGNINRVKPNRREEILDPSLTIEKLTAIMEEFVSDTQSPEDYDSKGWPDSKPDSPDPAYIVSKMGVSRLTELLVENPRGDLSKPGLLINSVCPGWVRTRMGTMRALRSVEEGADTPVYLSLLPPGTTEPNGMFLRDRAPMKWK